MSFCWIISTFQCWHWNHIWVQRLCWYVLSQLAEEDWRMYYTTTIFPALFIICPSYPCLRKPSKWTGVFQFILSCWINLNSSISWSYHQAFMASSQVIFCKSKSTQLLISGLSPAPSLWSQFFDHKSRSTQVFVGLLLLSQPSTPLRSCGSDLPYIRKMAKTLSSVKSKLKTHLFSVAFVPWSLKHWPTYLMWIDDFDVGTWENVMFPSGDCMMMPCCWKVLCQ